MKKEYRCENFLSHMCHGPLFLVEHNQKEAVYCTELIKRLIILGHGISIIKNVPRTDILKWNEGEKSYRYNHFFFEQGDKI